MLMDKVSVAPALNPAAQVVNYLKSKCSLAQDQI